MCAPHQGSSKRAFWSIRERGSDRTPRPVLARRDRVVLHLMRPPTVGAVAGDLVVGRPPGWALDSDEKRESFFRRSGDAWQLSGPS